METMLMIATVVALALALGMSGVAWRLLRDNRRRSAARVEMLAELAAEPEEYDAAPVRFASLDQDGNRTGSAVRGTRSGEPRNPGTPEPRPSASSGRPEHVEGRNLGIPESWDSIPLPSVSFATVSAPAGPPKRRWLALAMVGVVMAAIGSSVYLLYGPVIAAAPRDSDSSTPAAVRSSGPRPLELLSLRHSIDSDGTFTVTGLVQNPPDGPAAQKVVAVVYVFDRDGNYFASGKGSLDFSVLHPGDESPFVVRVPNVTRVSRYRVGFRSEEGGIVAHVDRRGQLPAGTTGTTIGTTGTTGTTGTIGTTGTRNLSKNVSTSF